MDPEEKADDKALYIARDYQIKLFEHALEHDSIVLLPTGSGKTFISTMVIDHILTYTGGQNSKAAFVVNNKAILTQQYKYIKTHTNMKVMAFDKDVTKHKEEFIKLYKDNDVIVTLDQTFVNGLTHGLMSLEDFSIIIIDECHHCKSTGHPCRIIVEKIKEHRKSRTSHPLRFIGLTSCGLNGKTSAQKLDKKWKQLEIAIGAKIITSSDCIQEANYKRPKEGVFFTRIYSEEMDSVDLESLERFQTLFNEPDKINIGNLQNWINQRLRCIIDLFEQYGIYCAFKMAESKILPALENKRNSFLKINENETILVSTTYSAIKTFHDFYAKKLNHHTSYDSMKPYLSPQTIKIIEVLQGFYQYQMKNDRNFKAIIFIEKREAAVAFCLLLQKLSEISPSFDFIKADFVIGSTKSKNSGKPGGLDAFRKGKTNIMVATQVLEEGIDIPSCNLVIFVNIPQTFTSYIQSRGRARKASSMFAMVVTNKDRPKLIEKLNGFKRTEKLLLERINTFSNIIPKNSYDQVFDFHYDDLEPPYIIASTQASVSLSTAFSVLERYISKLPSDPITPLSVKYEYTRENLSIVAKLIFPSNVPIKEEIIGQGHTSHKLSEMSAALAACKVLHQNGELDENLIPLTAEKICENLGYDSFDPKDGTGTNQKRRLYSKKISDMLAENMPIPGKPFFVYLIELDLIENVIEESNPKKRKVINYRNDSQHVFGLCFRKVIQKEVFQLPSFPVYEKYGKFMASFKLYPKSFTMDENELELMKHFHSYIFQETLGLGHENLKYTPNEALFSTLVIPLKRTNHNHSDFAIDFDVLKKTIKGFPQKREESEPFIYDAKNYENAVVQPSYYPIHEAPIYHVCEHQTQIYPSSPFPEPNYKTYFSYFSERYGEKITDQKQELLDVERIPKLLNLIFPPTISTKKAQKELRKEYLVPELVTIHPMPASIWLMVIKLPTILYRMNSLLIANELRAINRDLLNYERMPENFIWDKLDYLTSKDEKGLIKNIHQINADEDFTESGDTNKKHMEVERVSDDEIFDERDSGTSSPEPDTDEMIFDEPINLNFVDDNILDDLLIQEAQLKSILAVGELNPIQFYNENPLTKRITVTPFPSSMNSWFSNQKTTQNNLFGVSPAIMLQALTTKGACDGFNLERLETIGDSFLKISVTIYLYHSHPSQHEGSLSTFRTSEVCNAKLFKLACKKDIPSMMISTIFDPKVNWLPPGFVGNDDIEMRENLNVTTDGLNDSGIEATENYNHKLLQLISDKSVADCVEALIGAHLVTLGSDDTLKFMKWLGIKVLIKNLPVPSPVDISEDSHHENFLQNYIINIYETKKFSKVEENIGYNFRDRSLLIQAFTHVTYKTPMKSCYQRLEFLGDAVLDYLITRYLFEYPLKQFSPGELTDFRSALVNNVNFASLAVKLDMHKYLLHDNPSLAKNISQFISEWQKKGSLNFNDKIDADEKVLGDIFESLVGAIYLDCGMDLRIVWQIFYNIMKNNIEECCRNPPLSPIRELNENYQDVEFVEYSQDGQACSKVNIKGTVLPFVAIARSKRIAKKEAAIMALIYLKKIKN